MSYRTDSMPPVVRTTGETADGDLEWQIETQSGTVVQTYSTASRQDPDDWWDDMHTALVGSSTITDALHDLVRLNAVQDWEIIDDR